MANSIFTTDNREAFDNQSGNNSDDNKSQAERKSFGETRRITKQNLFLRSAVISSFLLVSIGVMAQTGLLSYINHQAGGFLNLFSSSSKTSSSKTSPSLSLSERYANRHGKFASAVPMPSPGGAGHRDTIGVFRPSNTVSYLRNTNSGGVSDISLVYGDATDLILTGDWDNDGIDSLGIYRNGVFYLRNANTTGGPDLVFAFGAAGDLPIAGDWNADGTDTVGIFRPSTGTFYLRNTNSAGNPDITFSFGSSGDQPIAGDWDGDGTDTVGFFRSSTTVFYLKNTNAGSSADISIVLGGSSDIPVSGDWNNSGVDTVGLYSSGTYYLWNSNNGGNPDLAFAYGGTGDKPITGNWDGLPADPPASNTVACSRSEKRLGGCNATGGTNLYSRNFAWGTGLAGLPGRSGLDAGFGLSYNSLVWIRKGSQMVFDPDVSNVSPGFRMGFPVIESLYNDFDTGRNTFIMVTPSGGRVEFRQVGTTNKYETPDSSYGELTLVDSNNITVRGTDGTQVGYTFQTGAFFVNQIKDANGNYITVSHDSTGTLQSVTDTLGRTININHDSNGYPTTIQQTWKTNNGAGADTTYTYATLSYTTIAVSANFHSSLTVTGLYNASAVTVLDKVTYPNGAYTKFDYNTLGQVWKVTNYAADGTTKLNHVAVNLDNLGTNLLDVPRFTQTKLWTKDFNNEQESIIPNTLQTGQSYSVPGATGTGTLVQITAPDGTISKTYFHETGWSEGLPAVTEDWSDSTRQRWTWTNWTQDNTSLSYILNPRVTESKVGDSSNIKRTTVSYHLLSGNISKWGLVNEVKVYDADQTTVLKTSQTTYNESATYISRRIIGLPSQTLLYDENSALMSKVTYAFDEGNFNDGSLEQNISPINHDNTNYGASFIQGRGNLTSTTRWDVTQQSNSSEAVTSQIKYNTAGSPVAQINPLNNQIKLIYADSFNDAINRSSYAYPTKVYDPAGNYSLVKYRYDIGANVWAKSPAPAGNTSGKETEREYDSLGRLTKDKIVNTGAYTRYEYMANGVQSRIYSTITDTNSNNTGDSADEVLTENWTDGAGRVLKSGTEHPGSVGGYVATLVEYDIMGRVKKSSVPTEINTSWTPAGDDATRGFLWTQNEYDWKGRTTRVINTDGTDKLYTYEGCGCAGGQVMTIKGEEITETDWSGNNPNNLGRRTQKVYADILGRAYKSEILNWDNSVYSSTSTTFNGRDQATQVKRFAGNVYSSTYQTMTMTYDGHGRLKTQHRPEQDANTNTTYNYNSDDGISSMVDARGATTSYSYNSRGLPTQVAYSAPAGITATQGVSYTYDDLGNPTQMTDGRGTVNFTYNELSQMTSETRNFSDTLANAPTGGFTLTYNYGLAGQLKSYQDPYGQTISYAHDKAGRLSSVSGSPSFGSITSYASAPNYTARGVLKSLTYGNGVEMNITSFNNKLQATGFELKKGSTYIMGKSYEYYGDGRLKKLDDHYNTSGTAVADNIFDRMIKYDQKGRVKEGKSGAEARGGTVAQADQEFQLPYRESFAYNEFDNTTARNFLHWGKNYNNGQSFDKTYTYQNNRVTGMYGSTLNGWQYDADGRALSGENSQMVYDAAGRVIEISESESHITKRHLDGIGREVKRAKQIYQPTTGGWQAEDAVYYIRSSVFSGQVIAEANSTGKKLKTYVIAGGTTIAWQTMSYYNGSAYESVSFNHTDASGMSRRMTDSNGITYGENQTETDPIEADAQGSNVGTFSPYFELQVYEPPIDEGGNGIQYLDYGDSGYAGGSGRRPTCVLDGIATDCGMISSEAAVQCPDNYCGSRVFNVNGRNVVSFPFEAYANGQGGWRLPNTSNSSRPSTPPVLTQFGETPISSEPLEPRMVNFVNTSTNSNSWGSWDTSQSLKQIREQDDPRKLKDVTDCQKFANEVDKIARETIGKAGFPDDVNNFMNRLAKTFTEYSSAKALDMRRINSDERAKNANYLTFGSGGFKDRYFEADAILSNGNREPMNQVRHAVGGLLAGFNEISFTIRRNLFGIIGRSRPTALETMNSRENNTDLVHGVPDINLNNQTVPQGQKLAGGQGRIHALQLGDWIRKTLCK